MWIFGERVEILETSKWPFGEGWSLCLGGATRNSGKRLGRAGGQAGRQAGRWAGRQAQGPVFFRCGILPPKIRGSQLLLTERIVHEDHQGSVTAETKEEGGPKGETVREKPTGDRNEQLEVLPTLAPFSLS